MKTLDTLMAERDAAAVLLDEARRRCGDPGSLAERLRLAEAERDFWAAVAALQARKASTAMASVRRFLAARRARSKENNQTP